MKKIFYLSIMIMLVASSCSSKRHTVLQGKNGTSVSKGNQGSQTSSAKGATSMSGLSYIERYKSVAISEMNKYGIPASIKLAQALLESGSGNSYLAREANNHFGIKCGGVWNGRSVNRPDDNENDCFRVYDNPDQSFKDHSQFLLRKRYEKLFLLDKDDYKGWARGLKSAGYATNPRYAELLIDMIERYELYRYDRSETYVEKEKREEVVDKVIEQRIVQEPAAVVPEQIKSPVAMRIHEVKAKETLYALSKMYNVSVEQIKQLNGLTADDVSIGQLLVISK
ncbi:glucosaminidase domain-containing protein [Sphingobacterium spiritivorum]|uniref:Peptidoglycan hydrolase n=1 Tax=Sphingobacterium spiritivorum ATCC 33861 TaxID=525373 RepID=D7VIZ2_SPHSI|nr:glucosaminidase domain-containing protein [Sphingobacterium spiritivorum]EFK60044.1 mannosyl-glycoprotein endo-beta-N-acetylglucosaminidase [Sphingobacterium spiritivorum ATCC 33861]QQT37332.1 glucosaminidase domain-containing protein [Sphingobacterium spiritivorum]WQD34120.1 glucosaminidase domain-containing protein [Sphingobacterium spiritivorum]SUJ29795.1 Exo-glucosaminidase lytG precursor [Sphingobacterium spiritivorum]